MEFQTTWKNKRINFYLIFLCAVAFISPFLHMFYLNEDKEGIFGYAYMSSFLYSLSLPLVAISIGLILKYLSKHVSAHLFYSVKYISYALVFLGFFFLSYTFLSIQDFSPGIYYLALTGISLALSIIAIYLNDALISTEKQMKKIISKLFDFIILETPRKHVSEERQIDYVISYEKVINEIGEE